MAPNNARKRRIPQGDEGGPGPSGTPTKKQSDKKPRQGAARKSKPAVQRNFDIPGQELDAGSFLNIDSSEQRVAAYLGFQNIGELRTFAITWPVLRAWMRFDKVVTNTSKTNAFELIKQAEKKIYEIDDPDVEWPIEDAEDLASMRAHHIAWILMVLEVDIQQLYQRSPIDNVESQNFYKNEFDETYGKDLVLPDISSRFLGQSTSAKTPASSTPIIVLPQLGPLEIENRLEAINRCWCLLKYFRYNKQAKLWATRFIEKGINTHVAIDQTYVPDWMRPKRDETSMIVRQPQENIDASDLPRKTFTVTWDQNAKVKHPQALKDKIDNAGLNDVVLPSGIAQPVDVDPRLCRTAAIFEDCIRRQYNCRGIRMELSRMSMIMKSTAQSASTSASSMLPAKTTGPRLNLMHESWITAKACFDNPQYNHFDVTIVFEAMDDEEDSVFTSSELPPKLAALFANDDGDVATNEAALKAKASAHFPTAEEEPEDEETTPDESPLEKALPYRFVSSTKSSPGEAPKPFHGASAADFDKMLKYYDDYDVKSPKERLEWQEQTIETLIRGDAKHTFATEKLSSTGLNEAQARALETARLMGLHGALAQEAEKNPGMRPAVSIDRPASNDARYHAVRSAVSGTQAQVGPPLDVCLQALDCVYDPKTGRYTCLVLEGKTTSQFYNFQITGGVGCFLKLHGLFDIEQLSQSAPQDHPRRQLILSAASKLNDLMTSGCLLADGVGFGKTKEKLLCLLLHSLSAKVERDPADPSGEIPMFG